MVSQYVIEDGKITSLKDFADSAIALLEENLHTDEVVQLADNIEELKDDKTTPPGNIYPLPEGYEYNFSGFFGQVIGVGRAGIRELHRRG